jgi:hypothetical protein
LPVGRPRSVGAAVWAEWRAEILNARASASADAVTAGGKRGAPGKGLTIEIGGKIRAIETTRLGRQNRQSDRDRVR